MGWGSVAGAVWKGLTVVGNMGSIYETYQRTIEEQRPFTWTEKVSIFIKTANIISVGGEVALQASSSKFEEKTFHDLTKVLKHTSSATALLSVATDLGDKGALGLGGSGVIGLIAISSMIEIILAQQGLSPSWNTQTLERLKEANKRIKTAIEFVQIVPRVKEIAGKIVQIAIAKWKGRNTEAPSTISETPSTISEEEYGQILRTILEQINNLNDGDFL